MAIITACGLECALSNDAAILHWGGAQLGTTVETDVVRSGTYSMKAVTSGGGGQARRAPKTATNRHWVARFYYRRVSGGPGDIFIDQSASPGKLSWDGGTGNFTTRVAAGTVRQGPTCAVDTWYLVDLHLDTSGATKTLSWQIDGVAQTDATAAVTAADLPEIRLGHATTGATGTSYFDDFLFGDAITDYPFGAGYVLPLLPNRDGTHSFTVGDFKDEAAANIAVAATTAYQKVDETVPNTSDYDAQVVIRSTGYLEYGFDTSPSGIAPRAVTVVAATFSSSNVTHTHKIALNDGGTIDDCYALRGTGGLSLDNMGKTYSVSPRTGVAFTKSDIDALFVRFGYATDVAPNPRLSRIALEVEYAARPLPPYVNPMPPMIAQ